MQKADTTSIIILIVTLLYWGYLLDPFTEKPQKRNYRKLLNNNKYLIIHLLISLLFSLTGIYRISNQLGFDTFAFAPFFLIIIIKGAGFAVHKIYNRDFILLVRGDFLKASPIDWILSIIVQLFPFLLSFLLAFRLS